MSFGIHWFLVGWIQLGICGWPSSLSPLSLPLMLVVLRESGLSRQSNGTRPLNTMCARWRCYYFTGSPNVYSLQSAPCMRVCGRKGGRGQMCQLQIGIICRWRSRIDHPERPITLPLPSMGNYCSQLLLHVALLISFHVSLSEFWPLQWLLTVYSYKI